MAACQPRSHFDRSAVLDALFDRHEILACRSMRGLATAVRELADGAEARGGDWREAITRVRECVPGVWENLDECERRRFLRHVRVYWDTRRHRMPPSLRSDSRICAATGDSKCVQARSMNCVGTASASRFDGARVVNASWRSSA